MNERMIVITDYNNPVEDFILQMIQITESVDHFEAQIILGQLKEGGEYEHLRKQAQAMGIF